MKVSSLYPALIAGGLLLSSPLLSGENPPPSEAPAPLYGNPMGLDDAGEMSSTPREQGTGPLNSSGGEEGRLNNPFAPYPLNEPGREQPPFRGNRSPGITGPGTDEPTGPQAALYLKHQEEVDSVIRILPETQESQAESAPDPEPDQR